MNTKYRQYFFDLRGRILSGQIDVDSAEREASTIISDMNSEAEAIAKRHGKKFKGFSFAALVR